MEGDIDNKEDGDSEGDGDVEGDGDQEGDVRDGEKEKQRLINKNQYIDATMHLAQKGNAILICCIYNFLILFRGFLFLFAAHRLVTSDDLMHQQAMHIVKKRPIVNVCHIPNPTCSHYRLPLSTYTTHT